MTPTPQQQVRKKTLILCDFDGTISTKDTVNRLVRTHLTSPEWRFHVKRYLLGDIGSKAVYEAVAPLMKMNREQLHRFVAEHAALDPDFPAFLDWARERNIDVKVVSDGFDETINTLFRNHGIKDLEVFANKLVLGDDGKVIIDNPHSNELCGVCGTCKLTVLRQFRKQYDKIILIGDGESDRHAATEADFVLALHELFVYCARNNLPAMRITGFKEIPHLLTRKIDGVIFDLDGTLVDSLSTITDAFNHMFSRLGYPLMTKGEVAKKTPLSLLDFIKLFLRPDEAEIGVKIFRDYYRTIFLERTKMMPGATEALAALNGALQGIITNKLGRYARQLAEHLGFAGKMAEIIGAEDGFRAKPAPDMFEEFLRRTKLSKQQVIYVGDTPVDIKGSINAGIDSFVIAGKHFRPEELAVYNPRRILGSISELPDAIRPIVD